MSEINKTALLFSGQGSQYVGMLKDIYEKYPEAKDLIDHADDILGYKISNICFDGPVESLKETRHTQPALFLHSSVVLQIVKDNLTFDACAGHSVGEYAALFAAGVLNFEDALKLVSLRGKLMFKAGEIEPGTMFAIINLPDEKVEQLCKELTETGSGNVIVPANYNSPGQVVISGSQEYLRENASKFKEAGARMVSELQVSGAFHSPLLRHAKEELEMAINDISFSDAKTPVYSNVFASPITNGNEIKNALVLQLMSPVKWSQTLLKMKENGFSKFIELGPGNVLQGLAKRTLTDVEISGIDKSDDIEKILA
jgi:[acyl-carrier-protein] S-malonyltransferase